MVLCLRTLGRFDLVKRDPEESGRVSLQPKRLALLAYLATATPRGLKRRDPILGLFWPELDQADARAALRQALHDIRRSIGALTIVSSVDEVGLSPDGWECDANGFERALDEGRLADAMGLYQGDFLSGVFLADVAPDLEQWVDQTRSRLRARAADAAKDLAARCRQAGDDKGAVTWAEAATRLAPDDESAVRLLMGALEASGERARSLGVYTQFAARLESEYDARPARATESMATALRGTRITTGRAAALPAARAVAALPPADTALPSPADPRPSSIGPLPAAVGTSADRGRAWSRSRGAVGGALILLLLAAGVFGWRRTRILAATRQVPAGSALLAVLPFENLGDSADTYLAEGVAGEIRGMLTKLPALRVIASGSSNYYRHSSRRPEEIARELGARYLLTGTVQVERGAGGSRRVRIRPELVEVFAEGSPETRWEEAFDTTLADVFDVQAGVANRVAEELGVVLSPAAQASLAKPPTRDLAAYDAYLRSGVESDAELASLSQRQLIAYAERAVALDSTFAAAWARLSMLESGIFGDEVAPAFDRDTATSRRAADRAIALAPNAADGHLARGLYLLRIGLSPPYRNAQAEFDTAYREFEAAYRIEPSSAEAVADLAAVEVWLGHRDAAALDRCVQLARLAIALDPRSEAAAGRLAEALLYLRRYGEARTELRRALEIHPTNLEFIVLLKATYVGAGDLPGANAVLRTAPATVDRGVLVRYGPAWTLDSADRALLSKLPVGAFDGDSAEWALHLAELDWLRGDTVRARDMAEVVLRAVPREALDPSGPGNWEKEKKRLSALGYLGDRRGVEREAPHWIGIDSAGPDNGAEGDDVLAHVHLALGDRARALVFVSAMLAKPYWASRATVRIDPAWRSLQGDPRFERLIAGAE
jgi:DNA-binding SARP family transcriptional activator/TolB-like protein